MIELGKMQKLEVVGKDRLGVLLNSESGKVQDNIVLPGNEAPTEIKIGDEIEVFVYKGSEERKKATIKKPKLTLGELAVLKVVDITDFGAFLDWGLEKDLLLPNKEQVGVIKKGGAYLVGLYINNGNRICATMKIYSLLRTDSPYKEKDQVHGTVYSINPELGVFVAIDNKYHGMIPNQELYANYAVGDSVEVKVKKVRADGKLELSYRQEAYNEIENDARKIMSRLKLKGGALPINDNSPPKEIKAELNISKRAFKRAVGRLLKEGAITITDEGIRLMW